MKNIINQTGISSLNEKSVDAEAFFGLSVEVFNPVNLAVDSEESAIGNYLQQLHIKNHVVASREVIHDLFTEKDDLIETENQMMSAEDEMLFEEIREAVSEKEIIDLRANLRSIGQSVSIHERSFEEIEEFVNGDLGEEIELLMQEEAKGNSALANEIELHIDIDKALEEQDIMKLRAGLKAMMQNEYSHSRTLEEIDGYLNDELDESALAQFEDELINNLGLAADISFQREVDRAISEEDVMALRAKLGQISREEKNRISQKLGILPPKRKNLVWYAAASVVVLLVVFTSMMRNKAYSDEQLYASYYQPYKSGKNISRSAVTSSNALNSALLELDRGNYPGALKWLESAAVTEKNGYSVNFFSGIAFQELGEYHKAISSFSEVVREGDNLLVEQSEWYIGLCYLRIEERQKAITQFRSISAGKGFYREQSNKLLRQLE